ncbi:MAG: poly-beta-1,6 N-acetyl-D-glucosamine synthase [Gammaproteobacteria bacterium]|nr:poly-beta-1,6 N-acetyl-D-glucosamine synthase [Gammaproteobacteria bacterium]
MDSSSYPIIEFLLSFAFYYPFFMAFLWMTGALYYRLHWENQNNRSPDNPPMLDDEPPVSLVVPCHNEGDNVRDTIEYLVNQDYSEFEVIAVNDGSTDNTKEILDELSKKHPSLRVIHLASNQGKAMALKTASLLANYEYLLCVDGDALLDQHATRWMIRHFVNSEHVGAVTGNPRIRNRTTLLGKIQVGEFSSIIGMIKRAQRIYGAIFTASGVIVAFRKSTLHQIGYWNTDMITEDIDISWRLQLHDWDIRYEPNALCWILMPETLSGLLKQRIRWAQGGSEVLLRYIKSLFKWQSRRMWPILFEYLFSVFWSYLVFIIMLVWLIQQFFIVPDFIFIRSILPGWTGVLLIITCLLQFTVSIIIDSRYEKNLFKNYFWIIWYPMAYWMINMITTVVGFPKAYLKKKGQRATWTSPDRGIH